MVGAGGYHGPSRPPAWGQPRAAQRPRCRPRRRGDTGDARLRKNSHIAGANDGLRCRYPSRAPRSPGRGGRARLRRRHMTLERQEAQCQLALEQRSPNHIRPARPGSRPSTSRHSVSPLTACRPARAWRGRVSSARAAVAVAASTSRRCCGSSRAPHVADVASTASVRSTTPAAATVRPWVASAARSPPDRRWATGR